MRRLTERLLKEFYSEPNSAFIEKFRKGGGLLSGSCLILPYFLLYLIFRMAQTVLASIPAGKSGFPSSWSVWCWRPFEITLGYLILQYFILSLLW